MAPLIGITTYPPNADDRYDLPAAYVTAVRRAGGEVVLVPPALADPAGLLDRLDGLVLSGGGDIDPDCFGGGAHETIYALDPRRDQDEIDLVHLVLERHTPTLAICRGSQILNVALGGTLDLHLPDLVAGSGDEPDDRRDDQHVLHRKEPEALRGMPEPIPHDVTVDAGSLVAEVMEAHEVAPMSWHHQAIDRLGDGLRAVAWAPDGTIEATEHHSQRWLVSVQWHPELTADTDPTQQRLFDRLVRAVREGGHR